MTLTDLSLTQAAHLLRLGEICSVDLVAACLERIDRRDPEQHAFLALRGEAALVDAHRADRQLAAGSDLPLLGVPIAVKDVLCVDGLTCTCGSKILEGFHPPFDATGVARLRAAGAIVVGKTNTDEFAMGSSTENSAYGATHNPWDKARVPGGSSGGSAAAVAARMVPAALGTDTGGSVRQPASFCGVTGLKPSYGRVSRYGLVAYGSSLDCLGVLSRTVEDAALVLGIMAGLDPLDSTTLAEPVPDYLDGLSGEPTLRGLRVGVPREYFIAGIQPEVETAVRRAVEHMASLGAEVHEVSLPHTEYALPVYYLIAPAEASANLARYDGMRYGPRHAGLDLRQTYAVTRGEGFGAEVKRRIMLGTYALSAGYYDAYYGQAQKVRTLIRDDFDRAFREVDLIACPVAPTTAFRIGENTSDPLAMYLEDVFTLPANLAGIPGVALPCGFDAQHLPIGMQLNGPPLSEALLLRAGWSYQQSTSWHLEAPAL
jgi:aspartyl-tRNA(Asn)/glutamyl-tRNA(Gln) amidotransferase subunit A